MVYEVIESLMTMMMMMPLMIMRIIDMISMTVVWMNFILLITIGTSTSTFQSQIFFLCTSYIFTLCFPIYLSSLSPALSTYIYVTLLALYLLLSIYISFSLLLPYLSFIFIFHLLSSESPYAYLSVCSLPLFHYNLYISSLSTSIYSSLSLSLSPYIYPFTLSLFI